MLHVLKKLVFSLAINTPMPAQHSFGSYSDQIFFKVFSKPDSSIRRFIVEFIPSLLEWNSVSTDTGGWTMYPLGDIPIPTTIAHSYFFDKHPFIEAPIRQGELKIFTNVCYDPPHNGATSIKTFQVILEFEKLDDAIKQFEKFRADLKPLGEEYHYQDESRMFIEVYSSEELYNIPCRLRIHLSTKKNADLLYQLNIST